MRSRVDLAAAWLLLAAMLASWPNQSCHAQDPFAQQRDIVAMYLFNGADEMTFRRHLESRAQLRTARIAEAVDLDAQQCDKLELATRGDLSRFYRALEKVRHETRGLDPQNQNEMQKAWELIGPLQQRLAKGLIDDDSLTDRILLSLLDAEQKTKYAKFLQQRREAKFRAILIVTISDMEAGLPLTEAQRRQLIELVESKELPKQSFEQPHMMVSLGYYMLGKLSDAELDEILDDQQKAVYRKMTARHAGVFMGVR